MTRSRLISNKAHHQKSEISAVLELRKFDRVLVVAQIQKVQ